MNGITKHIFLAGGGDEKDSRPLDEQFVEVLDLAKPLVYIPNAMPAKRHPSCLKWFYCVMAPLQATTIEMWSDLRPHRPITAIAGVYLGGGNTVKLLTEIRKSGFVNYLLKAIRGGIPIYGGSAGAVIFGKDIRTAPEARRLHPEQAAGLNVLKNYSVMCHYEKRNERTVRSLLSKLGTPIIAIPEKAGAYLHEDRLTNCGTVPLLLFRDNEEIIVQAGDSTSLGQ